MIIVIQPAALRRQRTNDEPAAKEHRIIVTPQLSIVLDVRWKPWEELGDVIAAWIEIKYFPNSDDLLWTRLGEYPLSRIARSYE